MRGRQTMTWLLLVVGMVALAVGAAPAASAHAMNASGVVLDVRSHEVDGEVQLPLDRLALALHTDLTPTSVLGAERGRLTRYTAAHVSAVGTDGRAWALHLGRGGVRTITGSPYLVYPLRLVPPEGRVTDVDLRYDVIVEEVRSHSVVVTVRHDARRGILVAGDAQTLGVLDAATTHLVVPAGQGSFLRGVAAAAGLGVEHVSHGADHLLFLLMLLLPAPLVAAAGRWRDPGADRSPRRSAVRVVHVVTAFAVGHSITLALAATGVVHLPTRPVEALVALSIGVSALHVLRPLVAHGEVLIAVGFGLVHGLAFASAIGGLDLDRASLVTTLLGFNLGIEITQLLVLALVTPSLLVLARTRAYPAVRVVLALVGLVFCASWVLERTGLTPADPFAGAQGWLVDHPLVVVGLFAALALCARLVVPARRRPPDLIGAASGTFGVRARRGVGSSACRAHSGSRVA